LNGTNVNHFLDTDVVFAEAERNLKKTMPFLSHTAGVACLLIFCLFAANAMLQNRIKTFSIGISNKNSTILIVKCSLSTI